MLRGSTLARPKRFNRTSMPTGSDGSAEDWPPAIQVQYLDSTLLLPLAGRRPSAVVIRLRRGPISRVAPVASKRLRSRRPLMLGRRGRYPIGHGGPRAFPGLRAVGHDLQQDLGGLQPEIASVGESSKLQPGGFWR